MTTELNDKMSPKKPYKKPILRVYGTMQDLTKTAANTGANNDVRGPASDTKTH
jgi:hypothetical protein